MVEELLHQTSIYDGISIFFNEILHQPLLRSMNSNNQVSGTTSLDLVKGTNNLKDINLGF